MDLERTQTEAERLGLGELVAASRYRTILRGGRAHLGDDKKGSCGFTRGPKDTVVEASLKELLETPQCRACFEKVRFDGYSPHDPWTILALVSQLLTQKERVAEAAGGETTSTSTHELVGCHLDALHVAWSASGSKPLRRDHPALRHHVWEECKQVRLDARTALKDPAHRLVLQAEASKRAKRTTGDELLGWSIPLEQLLWSSLGRGAKAVLLAWEAVETGTTKTSPRTGIVVPNVVAEWVGQMAKGQHRAYVPAHAPAVEAETCRTALALWEPDSDGALKSLSNAVVAAEAVHS